MKDISKFSFAELGNNENGKTSGPTWTGIFICVFGIIDFTYSVFTKQTESIIQSVAVVTIGASLLGFNKMLQSKNDVAGVGMTSTSSSSSTSSVTDNGSTTSKTDESVQESKPEGQ